MLIDAIAKIMTILKLYSCSGDISFNSLTCGSSGALLIYGRRAFGYYNLLKKWEEVLGMVVI